MGETEAHGRAFVISAPSGTGKTTVCREVVRRDPRVVFSVSHTTRPQRAGERNGVDYHFVDEREFRRLAERGAFLEFAEYNGRLYGTSWDAVEHPLREGLDVLLEIDIQGARQVRDRRPESILIFLLPPSFEALEERLRARGTDSPETIEQRLAIAAQELQAASWFRYWVVNEELDAAVADVLAILHAVRDGDAASLEKRFGRRAVAARLAPSLAERVRA